MSGNLPTITDAQLAMLQAAASAKAAELDPERSAPTSLRAKMPWAARIAAGAKVPRPLIWKADISRWRRKQSDYNRELSAIRSAGLKAASLRTEGDPLEGTLVGIWNQLLRLGRYTAGLINATYRELKKESGWSVDTLFESVAFFERAGVLEISNVRERGIDSNGKPGVFNAANAYMLKVPEAPPETTAAATDPASGILAAVSARVKTVAAWFGLEPRSSGYLNVMPMAARDLRAEAHPAPA